MTAVVVVVVLITHWPALSANALCFDDHEYLINNPLVKNPGWSSAKRFLTEVTRPSTVGGYYQPLSMISLMFDYVVGGRPDNLLPFHRTSLLLHVANTVLVVILMYLLFGHPAPAVLVGLLFGVHPLTVEPIPWIGERKTLLAAFFALGCLIFYVRYQQSNRRTYYLAALITYLLALMSKPTSVPLPLVMLLLDYWPLNNFNRRTMLEKVPFFILCFVSVYITCVSQINTASLFVYKVSTVWRSLLIFCHNIVFYLYKMVWPVSLVPHYPYPKPLDLTQTMVRAGLIGTCILIPLLLISLRWTRSLFTGWLIFFVTILPAMGVLGFSDVIASDKFAYLPSLGILMILTFVIARIWHKQSQPSPGGWRKFAVVVIVVVLAGMEIKGTRNYLTRWQDSENLCRYMLTVVPHAPTPYHHLAYILNEQGRTDEAINYYRKIIEIDPGYTKAHYNLALALYEIKQYDRALDEYRKTLELEPTHSRACNNYGVALLELGRIEQALNQFSLAFYYDPTYSEALNNLANALSKNGKYAEAVDCYYQILERFPDCNGVHRQLAYTFARWEKYEKAIEHYQKAVDLHQADFDVYDGLADAFYKQGTMARAIEYYKKALTLMPESALTHNNLAVALVKVGQINQAVDHYRKAIRLDPNYAMAHHRLANAYIKLRKLNQAIEHYRQAVTIDPKLIDAWNNLAAALIEVGNLDDAIECYREILIARPDNLNSHFVLAQLLKHVGQNDDAVAEFREVLRIDPHHDQAREMLEKLTGE